MIEQKEEKGKQKPIGIMNHWMVNNYGALFLAYALEKAIMELGYQVETISYLQDEVRRPWKFSMIKKVGLITYLMRLGYFLVFILPRERSFRYIRNQMKTSAKVYTDRTAAQIGEDYEKVMIGGDQLWNCKINYFHINHFLPFIQEKERKSVYAASLSQDKMREGFEDTFRELAEGFGYITAREQRAVEIIEELTHREVDRVTDPAFFLSAAEWGQLAKPDPKQSKPFCFVYQVQSDREVVSFAEKIAKKRGLEVVYCPFPLKKQIKCKRKPYISPEEWLWYMQNADYVVTDAFHGTVFSILFNRPFVVEISEYGKDTGSRITNILDIYSLQDRLMVKGDCIGADTPIDFEKINRKIEEEVQFGKQKLKEILGETSGRR